MIYVIRHQEGAPMSNCLSKQGLENTRRIGTFFSRKHKLQNNDVFKTVYTITPHAFKHVRPIQTASMLCSHLNGAFYDAKFSVMLCESHAEMIADLTRFRNIDHLDIIVVWHHGDIPRLVDCICDAFGIPKNVRVRWDDDNYNGCVVVDTSYKTVRFNRQMFYDRWLLLFKRLLCT